MTRSKVFDGHQVEQRRQELVELNRVFRSGTLLSKSFYAQLRLQGCDLARSVLVVLVPEGASTYSGKIIRQDGTILAFDIDLESAELSRWEDITHAFHEERRSLWRSKPWSASVVAYDLFEAGNSNKEPA